MQQNIYTAALPTPPGSAALPSASTFATTPAIAAPNAVPIECTEDQLEAVLRCSSEPTLSVPTAKTRAPSAVMLCAGPGHSLADRGARGARETDSSAPARPRETEVSNSSLFASRTVSAGNSAALVQPTSKTIASTPQLLSRSAGDLFHPSVKPRCVAPCPSTARRKVFRRALRCGQPACAGKWRRPHGSGEPPCKQRRFPAASCRLPGQGPDR